MLIAGGTHRSDLAPTAGTELFSGDVLPGQASAFAAGPDLSVPRRSHGAAPVPGGVLMIGGAEAPSCEVFDPAGGGRVLPLPVPLPSPALPGMLGPAQRVAPFAIGGHGVFAFGGGDGTRARAALYVEPSPPGADDRRRSLIFAQSRPLALARPIDARPVRGRAIRLDGLVTGLTAGRPLLIAGRPPLARTVGRVAVVGATDRLPAGTLVMVLSPVPGAAKGRRRWQAEVQDRGLTTLETGLTPEGCSRLAFRCGAGGAVGDVTPAEAAAFARGLHGECVTVRSLAPLPGLDAAQIGLAGALTLLYDRTTTTVYGNVVAATEGASVAAEVLGSGDGKTPFQSFGLRLAPLTHLPDAKDGIAPQLTVTVDRTPWARVPALGACGPDAQAYQLALDAYGRARVQFGDGRHGQRLPTGRDNVVARYRVGAGAVGNVPAGGLTRAPAGVAGLKGVLNPLPAEGGAGSASRAHLRRRIPAGVRGLARIVTQDDIASFLLGQPEVGRAVLTSLPGWITLATLTGPGNAVPDMGSDAFVALGTALRAAMAAPLACTLLPVEPAWFKLRGTATIRKDADPEAVRAAMRAVMDAGFGAGVLAFGHAVRLPEIAKRLEAVAEVVGAVAITDLWIPARSDPVREPVLVARPAIDRGADRPPALRYRGAEILALSPDADAVDLTLTNLDGTPR